MLGTRPQAGLFTAANQLDLDSLGIYGHLAHESRQIFTDYQFRGLYSDLGRPSASPALMATGMLLQHYEGISDDTVIDRVRYDRRWKAALDLDPVDTKAPFSKAAFQSFRHRLILHEREAVAFERSLKQAVTAGVLPKKLSVALDSSPVRGRGAVKDTFNLLSDAIRHVVRKLAEEEGCTPEEIAARIGVDRHFKAASVKGSELVDWDRPEDVSRFLAGLLEDGQRAVAEAKRVGCASKEAELLDKIVAQDVDQEGDQPTIRQGVAKDRLVSVTDPDMRHGHKSSGKKYSGHKAHLASETTTGIVTAVDVTAPGTADGEQVDSLIKQTEANTGCKVDEALGDCAYSSQRASEKAESVGTTLLTRMPGSRKGLFGPDDFNVSKDRTESKCPAGHAPEKVYRNKGAYVHHWAKETCQACPLRDQCVSHGKRRTLTVKPNFHDRRKREKWSRSEEGREKLRQRVVVEHALGRAKNRGAGQSRYFGRAKTRFQWLWTAAAENFLRLFALRGEGTGPQVAVA